MRTSESYRRNTARLNHALRGWPHYGIPHNTKREVIDPITRLHHLVDFIAIQVVHSSFILTTRAQVA